MDKYPGGGAPFPWRIGVFIYICVYIIRIANIAGFNEKKYYKIMA